MPAEDRVAIERLFETYLECWHSGDIAGWSACFTDDSDFVTWEGLWWTDLRQSRAGHDAIPAAVAAQMPTYTLAIAAADLLAPTVALIHAHWRWPGFVERGRPPEDRTGLLTMVLVRRGGDWRIRATHNVRSDDATERTAREEHRPNPLDR